jgi:hypothetical protein
MTCPKLSNLLSELLVCPSCCYVCADSLPVFHTIRPSCLHIVHHWADFLCSWNLSRSPVLFFWNFLSELMSSPVLMKLLPSWCPILSNLLSELMVCPSCCYVRAVGCLVFHTIRPSCLHIVDDRADFLSYSSWNLSRGWCPVLFFSNFFSELISCSTLLFVDFGAAIMILELFDVTDKYCPVLRYCMTDLMSMHVLFFVSVLSSWFSCPILNKLYDLVDGCPAMLEQGVAPGMSVST